MDEETGLYYYGARYYNPRESVWLSVDPLAEKYPNISPYAYTFQNPVRFIDPTGMEGVGIDDWVITGKGELVYDSSVITQGQAVAKYGKSSAVLVTGKKIHFR